MIKKYVIVVPCFNEEERFNEVYFNQLTNIRNTFWVFVNDGSTDDTGYKLEGFSKKKNTKYLKLNTNVGKANAIAQGMSYAMGTINNIEWLGFLDSDGAFSLNDVVKIIGLTNPHVNCDAIYSSRVKMAGRNIKRNYWRHIMARLITSLFALAWRDIPYDTQSGFKLYKYSADFDTILQEPFKTKWFFDIEIFIRFIKIKGSNIVVWEEPVASWFDISGSKVNYRQALRILFEIILVFYLLIKQRNTLRNHGIVGI